MPIVVPVATIRTLGQLKARVADELARADLAPQIALAIEDAISEAATHRFWFNEVRGLTFSAVADQEYYGSADIASLIEIDRLWIMVGSQPRNLREASADELNCLDGAQPTGEPYRFARYGNQIRFEPIPQQPYLVQIDGLSRLSALVNDSDSNGWTDAAKGERYVRALTKRNVLAEVIYDLDRADVQAKLAERYKADLLSQTHSRIATNEMRAYG